MIDSIKNPFESMYLKQRYSNYYLMGVYTDEKQRQERLLNNKKIAVEDIRAIDRVEQLKKFKKEYDDYKTKFAKIKRSMENRTQVKSRKFCPAFSSVFWIRN